MRQTSGHKRGTRQRILEESGLPIIAADDLADAAEKAVLAAAEAA